ncbi:serine hydrolase domain-containing protein [Pseudoblastomonas halimionae]|uniref:Serine hydrolase n=1 Tax=Alteriqipengyuania halimionae TaxID=1926630 RepID=A0A6I4U0I1_9SPHN|nr:serine hydrolase domain-containing protein [Alteriqipengyuania halimionae]MXP09286.1 serine hydrolase [Alteriqipengyuania halimionae]
MLRILALFALLMAIISPAAASELGDFVDARMEQSALPGVAWAVIEGDTVTTGARGTSDGTQPVTPDTPFLLGSISKSFTALAIMQLVEAGKIDPDAPVSDYLPDFKGRPAGAITIRQLLSHTSGYSTLQGNSAPTQTDTGADAIARRATWYAQQQPAYSPGPRWEYSNANYLILGRVIERVGGFPYPAYITANILRPIGMDHTYVSGDEQHTELAQGYSPWFGSMRRTGAPAPGLGSAPQGGIVSTANDFARYLRMMMNGRDDILSAAGKTRMLEPASDASPGYGFGWMLDAEDGSAYHTGLSPGFETIAAMIPAQRRGVVVLTNANGGMGFAETTDLRFGLVARALDLPQADDSGRTMRKINFLALAAAPLILLLAIVWAWAKRGALRSKRSSAFGRFSLWFPLLAMAAVAWVCLVLIPQLFGVSISTLAIYQPDMALLLKATAALGVVWAAIRLALAYSGRRANG